MKLQDDGSCCNEKLYEKYKKRQVLNLYYILK